MTLDQRALTQLIDQSADAQSDAMAALREPLAELVEVGRSGRGSAREPDPDRRSLVRASVGALAAGGLGAALLGLLESPAFADQPADVQMLQTAASIENLAVATYGIALTLPFIGGASANKVVRAFVTKTRDQHGEHGKAFNAAVGQLGGKMQDKPNPVLLNLVNQKKPTLTGPAAVVDLAITLETGAEETYVAFVGTLADANARKLTASIMGVEAQHVAILNAVKALAAGGHPELIALPPDAAALPAAAGSVGFPDAYAKTDQARPASEGAVP